MPQNDKCETDNTVSRESYTRYIVPYVEWGNTTAYNMPYIGVGKQYCLH